MRRLLTAIIVGSFSCMIGIAVAQDRGLQQMKQAYKRPSAIPFPARNPYTPEKFALGKALYFDPRLSGNENMSCASCHNPSFGWESPATTPVGAQNTRLARQAPTILNTAWLEHYFWDGRADTAEEQAKGPIEAEVEMNLKLEDAVVRLNAVPAYKEWFKKVFPNQGITPDTIVAAIATFERMIVASYAPFDAWIDGDERAISESAKRGFELFNGKAKCSGCHTGWSFTDHKFHDIGLTETDIGRGKFEPNNPLAKFAFKTPTLRDTAQRAPYMHAGQFTTLQEVVVHYESGGITRPSLSPLMEPLQLTASERRDIIEFMKTLTGSKQVVTLPVLPN